MTGKKNSILVVDDEPESLRLLVEVLERDGYQVRAAGEAESALSPFAVEPPDLILLDIRMPGIGGGLSISRSIVQAHGGRVWAENSATGGAVFRCVLPVAHPAAAATL
jgi:CheY-like chemotaxis protein